MRLQGVNSDGELLSSAYVEREGSVDTRTHFDGPSLTRQEFAEECDINSIMERYERVGVVNHFAPREPKYLDLSEVPDLHTALGIMQEAEEAFMSLPALVRREFENRVEDFVSFAADPENLPQMRTWGLAPPEEVPAPPMRVEVVASPGDVKPPEKAP
nr:MAG: internal scaffolding protein [Microvirus sp.]